MQVVDLTGGHASLSYGSPNSFYDSFVRVVVPDESGAEEEEEEEEEAGAVA